MNKRDLIGVLEQPWLCDACMKLLQPQLSGVVTFASIKKCFSLIGELNAQTKVTTVIRRAAGARPLLGGAVAELAHDE